MIVLYGRKTSINVQKAAWALAELGLDFDWHDRDGTPGTIDTADYRALNPQMRVPTLVDDGAIVRQSNVIVRYLARKYDFGGLCPADPGAAAAADYWMDWQAADNWRNLVAVFWNLVRVPPEQRDDDAVAQGVAALGDDMTYLQDQLGERPFLLGDTLTMADIPVGAAVHRFHALPIERPALPGIEAYYKRLQDRPAYAGNVMVPMP